MTIPRLTNWPTIELIARSIDREGDKRPLRIRRLSWTPEGESVTRWIYFSGGIWFQETASGTGIVEASEFTEEDFLGVDWTSLGEGCVSNTYSCEDISGFHIEGFYEVTPEDDAAVDFSNPNAPECGDACTLPDLPDSLDSSAGGDGGGSSGSGGSSGGGSSSGSSSGGTRRRRRPRPNVADSASITISNIIHDIPECLPLSGGELPENPHPYTLTSCEVTLSDPLAPGDLWFVKTFFKGELIQSDVLKHGDNQGVVINKSGELRWGFSHHITVSAWKPGRNDMLQDTKPVTMAFPCYDANGDPFQNDLDVL